MTHRIVPLLVAATLVAGACTDEGAEPAPSPSPTAPDAGRRSPVPDRTTVAVVLPPASSSPWTPEQLGEAIAEVRAAHATDTAAVRRIDLDAATFRRDVVTLLADEQTDLICVIGPDVAQLVAAVAREYPTVRFCAIGEELEQPPENVLTARLRIEEGAFVAGAAAAHLLPQEGGVLGFLTSRLDTRAERQRAAFLEGARTRRPEVEVAVRTVGLERGDEEYEPRLVEAAGRLYDEAEAAVVYLTSEVPTTPVLVVAEERLRLVVGSGRGLVEGVPEALTPFVLLAALEDVAVPLEAAVSRLRDGWEPGSLSFGFAQDALAIEPGSSLLYARVRGVVEEVLASTGGT